VTFVAFPQALQRQWPKPLGALRILPVSVSLDTSCCPALGFVAGAEQQTEVYALLGATRTLGFATGRAFFAQAFLLSSRLRLGFAFRVSCLGFWSLEAEVPAISGLVILCEFEFELWFEFGLWDGDVDEFAA